MKRFLSVLLLIILGTVAITHAAETNNLPAVIGPYLQNPTAEGMTVCFLAQGAEQVRVASPAGDAKAISARIPGTSWTIWKARVTKLTAGKTYEYQVHYRIAGKDETTPVYHFRVFDPQAKSVRFLEVNDIHNNDQTLASVMRWVKPDDYEFSVLLGDMWTNPSAAKDAKEVFRVMEAYVRLMNASEKPMLFMRGNHETIGSFADRLAYLFDIPGLNPSAKLVDQTWYYTLRAGPVWILAPDEGDDFTKRMEIFQPYRLKQSNWMRDLLAHHADAGATWRLLFTHQPLYSDDWVTSELSRAAWEPVLKDAGIDLEINGHVHCLWKKREKGKTYKIQFKGQYPGQQDPQGRKSYVLTPPFPGIIGGGPKLGVDHVGGKMDGVAKLFTADEKTLHVRLIAGKDGRLLTEFKAKREQ